MSTEIAVSDSAGHPDRFEESLENEEVAERDLMRSLFKSILVSIPISVACFLLIVGLAIGDKTDWYVWVGLGVGLGVLGGILLGVLGGATLNAHKLDEIDRHA